MCQNQNLKYQKSILASVVQLENAFNMFVILNFLTASLILDKFLTPIISVSGHHHTLQNGSNSQDLDILTLRVDNHKEARWNSSF